MHDGRGLQFPDGFCNFRLSGLGQKTAGQTAEGSIPKPLLQDACAQKAAAACDENAFHRYYLPPWFAVSIAYFVQ